MDMSLIDFSSAGGDLGYLDYLCYFVFSFSFPFLADLIDF